MLCTNAHQQALWSYHYDLCVLHSMFLVFHCLAFALLWVPCCPKPVYVCLMPTSCSLRAPSYHPVFVPMLLQRTVPSLVHPSHTHLECVTSEDILLTVAPFYTHIPSLHHLEWMPGILANSTAGALSTKLYNLLTWIHIVYSQLPSFVSPSFLPATNNGLPPPYFFCPSWYSTCAYC
jgi:hypothetical protein